MCINPRLIFNKKYTPNKKNGGIIPDVKDNRVLAVPIGCGECIECRKQKAREWQVRLQEDIRENKNGKFITLTFNNKEITKLYEEAKEQIDKETGEITKITGYQLDNQVATLATRRFLERIRKETKKSIRHWLITELGHSGTENIHMHGIIWAEWETIEKHWKYGYIWKGDYVNNKTINYIIKYVHKIDFDHKYYKSKILCSKGIGKKYTERLDFKINQYNGSETKEYYKTREGIKLPLPIYYRNKRYTEEERENLWLQKLDKQKRYILGKEIDVSNGMEQYYKILKEAKEKNNRLGYGNGQHNWEKEKYENERREKLQEKRKNNTNELPKGAAKELWAQTTKAQKGITPNHEYHEKWSDDEIEKLFRPTAHPD